MKNDLNEGINCTVKNCVFNEKGCNCNLEKVTISQGDGSHHYCKSYISKNDEDIEDKKEATLNVESGSDEYFDFNDLFNDLSTNRDN